LVSAVPSPRVSSRNIDRSALSTYLPTPAATYSSAIASAGVVLSAAQELATAPGPRGPKAGVFALWSAGFRIYHRDLCTESSSTGSRPPGHHAGTSLCGGYCFINNIAVAARFLQSLGPERGETRIPIAILDIDYHHGNGSKCHEPHLPLLVNALISVSLAAQEIFYSDSSVLYVSLHAEDDYPCMIMIFMFTSDHSHIPLTDFTGAVTEKGMGEGLNTNFNYPLPRGTQDGDYCAALQKATEDIRRFDPAYLLVRLSCPPVYDRGDTNCVRLSVSASIPLPMIR